MPTLRKSQMLRLSLTVVFILVLLLAILVQIGRASTKHQTVPTAPPTTAVIPTSLPTIAPTNPPQATVIPPQSTREVATQTPGVTASLTVVSIVASPSHLSTKTEMSGNGTIPQLTSSLEPSPKLLISPSSHLTATGTANFDTQTDGSRGIFYYLIGGGVVLVLAIGTFWIIRTRRR